MAKEKTTPDTPHGVPNENPVALTPLVVRTSELDSFGHVNHAVYLTYFEHARFQALKEAGFDWNALEDRGWAIFVVRVEVDYLAEAGREDRLMIRTQAESFRRTSMLLAQDIVRDDGSGTIVAQAKVTAVWIGPNRRPMRVPEEVREGLTNPRG
jgi:YbgC/YbaW family acyl-CoA thioester hydrolase